MRTNKWIVFSSSASGYSWISCVACKGITFQVWFCRNCTTMRFLQTFLERSVFLFFLLTLTDEHACFTTGSFPQPVPVKTILAQWTSAVSQPGGGRLASRRPLSCSLEPPLTDRRRCLDGRWSEFGSDDTTLTRHSPMSPLRLALRGDSRLDGEAITEMHTKCFPRVTDVLFYLFSEE